MSSSAAGTGAASAAAPTARNEIIAAIAIDGSVLARAVGFSSDGISSVVRQIEASLATRLRTALIEAMKTGGPAAAAANVDPTLRPSVRTPGKGRVFFMQAQSAASISSVGDFAETLRTRNGWTVAEPAGGAMEPTDAEMRAAVTPFLARDFFDPVGASTQRKTATDVVIVVAGASDHIALLRQGFDGVRTWCFTTKEARTPELEEWGSETSRVVELRPPRTPAATTVTNAALQAVLMDGGGSAEAPVGSNAKLASAEEARAARARQQAALAAAAAGDGAASADPAATAANEQHADPQTMRATCADFDSCPNPRCLFRHADSRPRVCEKQYDCVDKSCPKLHFTLWVRGLTGGPVPVNLLAPTAGKQRALFSGGWSLPVCPYRAGATCTNGARCRSLHFVEEAEALQRAAEGALQGDLPADHILVDGIPVAVVRLESSAGLRTALTATNQRRAGTVCANGNGCPDIDECAQIHFREMGDRTGSGGGAGGMGGRASSSRDHSTDFTNFANTYISGGTMAAAAAANRATGNAVADAAALTAQQAAACVVCGDEFGAQYGVLCEAERHFTCDECVSAYIDTAFMDKNFNPGEVPFVRCPVTGCTENFTDVQIARHAEEEAVGKYLKRKIQAITAEANSKAMSLATDMVRRGANSSAQDPAERELLTQTLRNMLPNALMCPTCRWGPVDFHSCSDLASHHGERVRAGVVVDNSCRHCGFHGQARADWLRWDGIPRLDAAEIEQSRQEEAANPQAQRRVFARDEDMDEWDEEFEDGPLWGEDPNDPAMAERRRQQRRQQRFGGPGLEQLPAPNAWMHANSGQHEIIYHSSGSIQLVFQQGAAGWLFAMRSPQARQQTLYGDGFFVEGAENRMAAAELQRNFRQERMHQSTPPPVQGLLNGFVEITKHNDAVWCLLVGPQRFCIMLHPTKLVLPSMNQVVPAECSEHWYMYSPLSVLEEQRQARVARGEGEFAGEETEADPAARDGIDEELAGDMILLHASGDMQICLHHGSNGWYNFSCVGGTPNVPASVMWTAGNHAPQERRSMSPLYRPTADKLVPVSALQFGQWAIQADRLLHRGTGPIVLTDGGFTYQNSQYVAPVTTARIDAICEAAIYDAPAAGGSARSGPDRPPVVRPNVDASEVELMQAVAAENAAFAGCAEETLQRFPDVATAIDFFQYCQETNCDPRSGDAYGRFAARQNTEHAQRIQYEQTRAAAAAGGAFAQAQPNPPPPPGQQPGSVTFAGLEPMAVAPPPSGRAPNQEEIDLVVGITTHSEENARFALQQFTCDIEASCQFLFYCLEQGQVPQHPQMLPNFRRTWANQQRRHG